LACYDEEEEKNGTLKSKEKFLKGNEPTGIKKLFGIWCGGK